MSEGLPWTLGEAFASRKPEKVAERQRARLAEAVASARARSPYYRELYEGLPERIDDATLLPVTSKKKLMARFDDWVTDRAVTVEQALALPAIRVQGRTADVLSFPTAQDGKVTIAPLAFVASLDRIPGIALSQIVQATPASLRVRLRLAAGADADRAWQAAHTAIRQALAEHELGHVAVQRAEEPPEQFPGGKYRAVIPLT